MSPIKKRKLPHSNRYRVYEGKKVVAKRTTKDKADAQMRFLRGLKHGMKPKEK